VAISILDTLIFFRKEFVSSLSIVNIPDELCLGWEGGIKNIFQNESIGGKRKLRYFIFVHN